MQGTIENHKRKHRSVAIAVAVSGTTDTIWIRKVVYLVPKEVNPIRNIRIGDIRGTKTTPITLVSSRTDIRMEARQNYSGIFYLVTAFVDPSVLIRTEKRVSYTVAPGTSLTALDNVNSVGILLNVRENVSSKTVSGSGVVNDVKNVDSIKLEQML